MSHCFVCFEETPTLITNICKCRNLYVHKKCLQKTINNTFSHRKCYCPICLNIYSNIRISTIEIPNKRFYILCSIYIIFVGSCYFGIVFYNMWKKTYEIMFFIYSISCFTFFFLSFLYAIFFSIFCALHPHITLSKQHVIIW